MHRHFLAAVATIGIASPALARDGHPYVGIEGGILIPSDLDGNASVGFSSLQPAPPFPPASFLAEDAFDAKLKRGYDIDAILGYDFGVVRLEGELGYKRAKRKAFDPDSSFLSTLNAGLNRPSAPPDPGAPGLAPVTNDDFADLDGKVTVKSAMINVLGDLGDDEGLAFYGGGGVGRAWGRALDDGDGAWAWQLIAGLRSAISANIEIGLKYRYFRTGELTFKGGPLAFAGNRDIVDFANFVFDRTYTASISPELSGKFQSHSLLASLIFNFGARAPAPDVVAPLPAAPLPPPPVAATQSCADGSAILAVEVCPSASPPPPPTPEVERG